MEKNLVCAAALALLALCLLGGCAADPQAADANDPYHLERNDVVAHGEASISYGHRAD
jgi:uncharacterized lipoprotein YajG